MSKEPRVGQFVPHLPEEYTEGRKNRPAGIACMMATDECPVGLAILLKDSTIVEIIDLSQGFHKTVPTFDGIVIHPDSLSDAPMLAKEEEIRKKFYS